MRHPARRSLPVAFAIVAVCCPTASAAPEGARWMGVASCAASACHHQGGGRETLRSEYTTWAAHDKHARAYDVLSEQRARQIVRNLLPDRTPAPQKEPLCLKCHAMAYTNGTPEPTGDRFSIDDGVGCESCHGPAEKWLGRHYLDGFKALSIEEKSRLGLHDLKGLTSRFATCAACHIGSADREVNHELIASGHPRLNFEFGGFLAKYSKHWPAQNDRDRYRDFEARAWLVGQVAGAKSSVELLKARADRAAKDGKANWPEFAEYSCFECHRSLAVPDWKLPVSSAKHGDPDRRLGELSWNTWYMALTPTLAQTGSAAPPGLDALRPLMRGQGGETAAIATRAATALTELDAWLAQLDRGPKRTPPMSVAERERLLLQLTAPSDRRIRGADWDEAAQIYLGLSALCQDPGGANADPRLAAIRAKLPETARLVRGAFPGGADSPGDWTVQSALAFQKQMSELRKLLGH